MPAPKKVWIHDGHIDRYPSVLVGGSVHMGRSCTDCHGGVDGQNARATAHTSGFQATAVASNCASCHAAIVTSAASGLHTTLAGYPAILRPRGFDENNATTMERFDAQCTKCHAAVGTSAPETACGQCHVSVPSTAGGGLLAGHGFQAPSMDNNCTACHGSRVKDEFQGLNNELLERNKPHLADGVPWKDPGFALQPDVHFAAGKKCAFCHGKGEMHGVGHPVDGDRYDVTTAPSCQGTGCHDGNLVGVNSLHTAPHLDAMDCQICHAQPYKNCFECHTDVTDQGVPFYTISDNAPDGNHDHLMSFRAGRNPKFQPGGSAKEYAVLRHVPVDADVFTYTGTNAVPGLLPNVTALPTWKYATPHNIQRVTPIQSSCSNCHGPDYAKFWLTDAVQNGEGWISPSNAAMEQAANSGVEVTAPFGFTGPSR